jgi:integrase
MPAKALNDSVIKAAKPRSTPYKLSDLERLYVLVSTAGSKTWKWSYRLPKRNEATGKIKVCDCTYTLGRYPEIALTKARDLRSAAEKLVRAGIHPADHDEAQKQKRADNQALTFWLVADEWIKKTQAKWSDSYARQVRVTMERYVKDGSLGNKPLRDVTAVDIYELVDSVACRKVIKEDERRSGAPTLAIMLRQWCSGVFRFGIMTGRCTENPAAQIKASEAVTRPAIKHNVALKSEQITKLQTAVRNYKGTRAVVIAIELLMLTFVRTGELRLATWDEFDLDKALWVVPAARMKVKKHGDHVIPLSKQAVALLRELKLINPPPTKGIQRLFPNTRRPDDYMTATTINRALERLGFAGKGTLGFTAHGTRGTASTHLHDRGFEPHVIEAQLAHKQRNTVAAAYNKAEYLSQRVAMMQAWADYLEALSVPNSDYVDNRIAA